MSKIETKRGMQAILWVYRTLTQYLPHPRFLGIKALVCICPIWSISILAFTQFNTQCWLGKLVHSEIFREILTELVFQPVSLMELPDMWTKKSTVTVLEIGMLLVAPISSLCVCVCVCVRAHKYVSLSSRTQVAYLEKQLQRQPRTKKKDRAFFSSTHYISTFLTAKTH